MPPIVLIITKFSAMSTQEHRHHHFLIVTVSAQGHINPARRLSHHLVRLARVSATLAVPTSTYRRMFPSATGNETVEAEGLISCTHYSDGTEVGFSSSKDLPAIKLHIKDSLSLLTADLVARGRPVTCIIYDLLLAMAADVAHDIGVPTVLFWTQPATVFAIYSFFFRGYADITHAHDNDPSFTVALPGLPPLQIRDLPSFLTSPIIDNDLHYLLYLLLKDVFDTLDKEATVSKPRILVNTFQELESEVLSSVEGGEMIAVGPLVTSGSKQSEQSSAISGDLYAEDSREYRQWLDKKKEKSVVYISFGSISKMSGRQMEEIRKGLAESGRPYLWVVRRDNGEGERVEAGEKGMVVEWCSQDRVLSHPSIGCFVTHCGWNSTLESMVGGVPMVMVPQWTDQATNARLAEEWGIGVRATVDGEGVLEGRELMRCLDVVMEEEKGKQGAEIRMRSAMWRDKAVEALGEDGSSGRNLRAFVDVIESTFCSGRNLRAFVDVIESTFCSGPNLRAFVDVIESTF